MTTILSFDDLFRKRMDVSQGKILEKKYNKIKLKNEKREMCTHQKYKQDKHVHQYILRIEATLYYFRLPNAMTKRKKKTIIIKAWN